MRRRGWINPRRRISEVTRWGWGPSAIEKKLLSRLILASSHCRFGGLETVT